MSADHAPALAVALIATAYWGCVCAMMVRVRRRARRRGESVQLLVPSQPLERVMWFMWLPLIAAWIWLPFTAAHRGIGRDVWISMPACITGSGVLFVRLAAVVAALLCLVGSIRCWRHMGRHWRMAVDPNQQSPLLVDGPFAVVRHPIYALSIAMMISSVIAVPTPTMALIGATHLSLMHVKARNEERFLRSRHGTAFDDYCRRTGRFIPRRGSFSRTTRAPHP